MPLSYQNVPVVETGIPETVVTYKSIDLETPNPAVTLPELNETVPNASLSEDLVSSSTSTTHRYLFNTTQKLKTNMLKKEFNWSVVHRSEMTCYKIHTLVTLYQKTKIKKNPLPKDDELQLKLSHHCCT